MGSGFDITVAKASLILHWYRRDGRKHNFGTFFPKGDLNTNYIVWNAEDSGDPRIGEDYLETVAALIPGASVLRKGNRWTWRVVIGGRLPRIRDVLNQSDKWLNAIKQAAGALDRLTEED